jgi:hypothetical protein
MLSPSVSAKKCAILAGIVDERGARHEERHRGEARCYDGDRPAEPELRERLVHHTLLATA